MGYSFPADLKQLVEQQMASGRYQSEDELIRDALDALSAESAEAQAIQAAIDDWRAGDEGLPLDEAFALVRQSGAASTTA
jgi:putative addiction module CopG family antidote